MKWPRATVPMLLCSAGSFAARPSDGRASLEEAVGLEAVDGVLRAVGPRFKVDFRAGGIDYTARLGAAAPRSLPLAFELESVRVGGAILLEVGAPREPALAGDAHGRVDYAHRAGVTERYEVRPGGIEQSFAFAALPDERGELVVRGRIATELALPAPGAYADGLEFRAPTGGGVRIGAVRGFDAAGREAAGALRFDGAHLELALPAEFVAGAALPLVLDPLIGSIATVYDAADGADPEVTYSSSGDQYLVAFERQWSGTDIDVYAQRISAAGALVGGLVFLETSVPTLAVNPTATSTQNGGLVVAWQQGGTVLGPWDVAARAIDPATGALGATGILAGSAANEMNPDAWGPRASELQNYAVVVWEDGALGIRGARLTMTSATSFQIGGAFTISSSPNSTRPAIARGGTKPGFLGPPPSTLVVWQRQLDASGFDFDLYGRVIQPSGAALTPESPLVQTVDPDELHPDVDGDGTFYVVAYESRPAGLGALGVAASSDLLCRRVQFTGSALAVLGVEEEISPPAPAADIEPAVAFLGPKYAVAWSRCVDGDLDFDVQLRLLDPADCTVCDSGVITLGSTPGNSGRVELAARRAAVLGAGAGDDQALLVWETTGTALPFDGDVFAQQIEAIGAGGSTVVMGGGCGSGGTIGLTGAAAIGNPSVTVTLNGADAGAVVAFMNVAGGAAPLVCGACTWEPFSPFVVVRPVVAGAASYTSAIPCDPGLIGAVLRYQWTVAFTSASPCPLSANVSLSDRLDVTYLE